MVICGNEDVDNNVVSCIFRHQYEYTAWCLSYAVTDICRTVLGSRYILHLGKGQSNNINQNIFIQPNINIVPVRSLLGLSHNTFACVTARIHFEDIIETWQTIERTCLCIPRLSRSYASSSSRGFRSYVNL